MDQLRLGRVSEDTICNALYYLRAECVRDGRPGLEHVDALLRLRGYNPEGPHIPQRVDKTFKRGELQRLVLTAMREGCETGPQIAKHVAEASGLPYKAAYKRVYAALHRMKMRGLFVGAGRFGPAQEVKTDDQ